MPVETWGVFDPGKGFPGAGRRSTGELSISGYALLRYLNQMPGEQTYTDHLGKRADATAATTSPPHRVMLCVKGWLGNPKLIYILTLWTVLDTDQDAIFGIVGYQFAGVQPVRRHQRERRVRAPPGVHPYWLGHDRVMADEFFRPFFAPASANGELIPGFWYNVQLGSTNSILGVGRPPGSQLTHGGSVWWMPTTHEFGPRGAYGDWERPEQAGHVGRRLDAATAPARCADSGGSPRTRRFRLADSVKR